MEIPTGTFVFTSDTKEIGEVASSENGSFTVDLRESAGTLILPDDAIDEIASGRMVLALDSRALRSRYMAGREEAAERLFADPEEPESVDHLPEDALKLLWDKLPERTWHALHQQAHAEEESDGADVSALKDVVHVAAEMDRIGEPFPATFEEFRTVMNRRAESMPHEVSDSP